jgi:hypothetical protein
MHRTMEFIVEQQAQFAANTQRLQEERIRDNPRLTRLEESFQLLVQLAQTTDIRLDRLESTLHPRIDHLQPRIKYGCSCRGTDSHR